MERHDAIASLEQIADHAPVQCGIGPHAHPLSPPMGRAEELLAAKQPLHIVRVKPKGNRRSLVHPFEGGKCSRASSKIRMTPGRGLASLRERKTQCPKLLQYLVGRSHGQLVRLHGMPTQAMISTSLAGEQLGSPIDFLIEIVKVHRQSNPARAHGRDNTSGV